MIYGKKLWEKEAELEIRRRMREKKKVLVDDLNEKNVVCGPQK